MKIAFLVSSPDISGGSFVIFEHALGLIKYGYDITMLTERSLSGDKSELNWHVKAKSLAWASIDSVHEVRFDFVIATWWRTVFELHRIKAKKYVYFNQSVESKFYHESEKPLRKLADSAYMLGLPVITEATWIKEHIETEYGDLVWLVKNGIRKDIFNLAGPAVEPRDPTKLRVLVEGPINVDFKNVPKTVALCLSSMADEVWLLTSSDIKEYTGVDRVFSRIPVEQTAEVYRSCDVIVKLSYVEGMFGPPLEMFHCGGTSITYDVTGHDEYIVDGFNGLVAEKDDDESVVSFINELKLNRSKLLMLKNNAIQTAENWLTWHQSTETFNQSLLEISEQFSESHFTKLKEHSNFMFDWYVVAENYKNALGDENAGLKQYLKSYVKFNWPKAFILLKKLKSAF